MSGHYLAAEDLIALIPQRFICLGIHFQVGNKHGKSHMVTISHRQQQRFGFRGLVDDVIGINDRMINEVLQTTSVHAGC